MIKQHKNHFDYPQSNGSEEIPLGCDLEAEQQIRTLRCVCYSYHRESITHTSIQAIKADMSSSRYGPCTKLSLFYSFEDPRAFLRRWERPFFTDLTPVRSSKRCPFGRVKDTQSVVKIKQNYLASNPEPFPIYTNSSSLCIPVDASPYCAQIHHFYSTSVAFCKFSHSCLLRWCG